MKRWKCTVCKYIHEGDEPPDICPVCKVGKEKFVEIDEHGEPIGAVAPASADHRKKAGKGQAKKAAKRSLIERTHAHPISVHIPNGVIPISVFFVFAATFLNFTGLGKAAFYNNLCVVVVMPVVLYTGYMSWRSKYEGVWTSAFVIKIVASTISTLAAFLAAIWYYVSPDVLTPEATDRWPFLLVNVVMLLSTSVAGYIGGKLVFKD
jgi:rubredoxin/amino acid transporter